MAKITGPLMSVDARGNWGSGTLQCRGGLHGTHIYRPAPPNSINQAPATAAQASVRARYAVALSAWRQLSTEERQTHNAEAQPLGLSGWNLYLQAAMSSHPLATATLLDSNGHFITTNSGAAIITD